MTIHYDFIVIGSGVSGGKFAHLLTLAGAKCLLIEAGKNYKKFPGSEIEYSSQLFWGGGLELSTDAGLGFLRAKCLGGTSIVNQALVDRFDRVAFDDWKSRSNINFFTTKAMAPIYKEVESKLEIQQIPEKNYNQNAKIFTRALDSCGYEWKPLDRAQSDCGLDKGNDCIVCLGGCPRKSKQSSLITSIEPAIAKGLIVKTETEVVGIKGQKGSFLVQTPTENFSGNQIVLASGSLGNTKILFNSEFGPSIPSLGKNFYCHPQYMSYGLFNEPVDAHKGAFQAVKSADPKFRRASYKFENVFAPPIGTAMLFPGFGRKHMELMRSYRYMASIEVCLRDDGPGHILPARGGGIKIEKKLTTRDRIHAREAQVLIEEFFESAGAQKVITADQGFGLHLMGGCGIGTDGSDAVVNPEFQIHDHPGIFVADSSVFPSAPGINPSLTIMALTTMAAKQAIR